MKRILTIGLMLASALALTNCTEEIVDPNAQQETAPGTETTDQPQTGIPFQVYASLGADTKTEGYFVTDENNKTVLKTKWSEGDKITVFHALAGTEELISDGLFTVVGTTEQELSKGLFTGELSSELESGKNYDWYFVYDATDTTNPITLTDNETTISIGAVEQTQSEANNNAHISGINCPMYGKISNLNSAVNPRMQMTHLASLYEVIVQNETAANTTSGATGGDIVVYDLGMSVSTEGTWLDDNQQEALVGDFTFNVLDGSLSKVEDNENYSIKLTLGTQKTIEQESEASFYFVTAPLDKIQTRTTISHYTLNTDASTTITTAGYEALSDEDKKNYTAVTLRKDTFNFIVNGSLRTVPSKATDYNMQSGNVHRFELPVTSLTKPLASNGFNLIYSDPLVESEQNKTILTISGTNPVVKINGTQFNESTDDPKVYCVGTAGTAGTISIKGFAKEMFNALPLGFYTSRWNDLPTAMTIKSLNVWVPEYKESGWGDYKTIDYTTITKRPAVANSSVFGWPFIGGIIKSLLSDNGITLNATTGIDRATLLKFIDANTITFKNIFANGYIDKKEKNIVVMRQTNVYKSMSLDLVNTFLRKFNAADGTVTKYASYSGIYAILNAKMDDEGALTYSASTFVDPVLKRTLSKDEMRAAADETAYAIYNKLYNTLENRLGIGQVLQLFFDDPNDLKYKLRDMKFEIVLQTYPYAESYSTTDPTSPYNPMLFWGLHYYGQGTTNTTETTSN